MQTQTPTESSQSVRVRDPRGETTKFDPATVITDEDPRHPAYDPERAARRQPSEAMVRNVDHFGVLQHPRYARKGDLVFIIMGNRRIRAARQANELRLTEGRPTMRVECSPYTGKDTAGIAATENFVREDETPLDAAEQVRRYVEDLGHGIEEASVVFGRPESWVQQHLKLLTVSEAAQQAVAEGTASVSAVLALADATPNHDEQTGKLAALIASAPTEGKLAGRVRVKAVQAATKGNETRATPGKKAQKAAMAHLETMPDLVAQGALAYARWILDGTPCSALGLE